MRVPRGSIAAGFVTSAARFPDHPALVIAGATVTYTQLFDQATSLAATLMRELPGNDPPLVAVFAERSITAYAGVLAALLSGNGYVPLSPHLPAERNRTMFDRSGCRAIIVDEAGLQQLPEVVTDSSAHQVVLLPDCRALDDLANKVEGVKCVTSDDLEPPTAWQPVDVDPGSMAYLLFTSGSTGIPKGVMVSHANVEHFLDFVVDRYQITAEDRLSQTFDLIFDLSVFDLFAAWRAGASICVPDRGDLLMPARYLQESAITIWFSVPSVGRLMHRLRLLEPGAYPDLRLSLFCGEALTTELAESWATAAPNSIVENLYGPTELTLACTYYRYEREAAATESRHGVVPIGRAFPAAQTLIADESLHEVQHGADGELLVAGPQVALGYFRDEERTAAAFVVPPGQNHVFYRTGDRVCRSTPDGPLLYLGRVDHQIKIHGKRIELGEIDAALREVTGIETVAAVGWPVTEAGADGIVAFVAAAKVDARETRQQLAGKLPDVAVPRAVHAVDELPLNANGKIDRGALVQMCDRLSSNREN